MDFDDVLRRRRMVRNYTDEPVPREAVERIVARALKAPSAGFSQGMRMVVVNEADTRKRIAELADEPYYLERGYEPWISRAPVHVVVALRENDYHDRYTEPNKLEDGEETEWPVPWWWVDAGQALLLILLGAVVEGLGAGLFTLYPAAHNDRLRELLGMPEDLAIVGVVANRPPGTRADGGAEKGGSQPAAAIARRGRPLGTLVDLRSDLSISASPSVRPELGPGRVA